MIDRCGRCDLCDRVKRIYVGANDIGAICEGCAGEAAGAFIADAHARALPVLNEKENRGNRK